ncbi:hypothetical protein RI129_000697 [Pyrocoelia pectoralis]|uniref:C2H2-type domain-containing protein n=1 Tax=Pyrocoelia pectoralis TaxID=417401 RepID=A0AAN7VTI6_9COLE
MAVFFKNDCTYGCGKSFITQSCLIEHIECTHLDMDPKRLAEYELQNHSCVPLSYILKYSSYESVDLPSTGHIFKHSTNIENQICIAAYDGIEVLIDSYNNNEPWTFKKGISERPKTPKKKRKVSDNGKKNLDYRAHTTVFSSPIYFVSSPCFTEKVELELSNRFENNITNNDIKAELETCCFEEEVAYQTTIPNGHTSMNDVIYNQQI